MNQIEELLVLQDPENIQVFIHENMKRFSTMRLNSRGSIIIVKNLNSLQKVIKFLCEKKFCYTVVGLGSNLIFPDAPCHLYIKLDFLFDSNILQGPSESYTLPASCPLGRLTSHAKKFGNKGWEVFTGIPGSLGGAVVMNAGTKLGDIGHYVKKVRIITKKGLIKEVTINSYDDYFAYRKNKFVEPGDIIYEVVMSHDGFSDEIPPLIAHYLQHRMKTQPLSAKTCGCVFKNHSDKYLAGKMIDSLGLKGLTYKGISISTLHANFMENTGEATYKDFKDFVSIVQNELYLQFGIHFELEVHLPI